MTDNTEPTQQLSTTLSIHERGIRPVGDFHVQYTRRNESYEVAFLDIRHGSPVESEYYFLRRGDTVTGRKPDGSSVSIYHDATAIPPTGLGKLYLVLDGKNVGINYD